MIPSAGENVDKLDQSLIADENVNWYSHLENNLAISHKHTTQKWYSQVFILEK